MICGFCTQKNYSSYCHIIVLLPYYIIALRYTYTIGHKKGIKANMLEILAVDVIHSVVKMSNKMYQIKKRQKQKRIIMSKNKRN